VAGNGYPQVNPPSGSEYGRTVDESRNRRTAERELRERQAKVDELDVRPLSEASRQRLAMADANRLVTDLMRERGYPVDDFDTRSELDSVDHPEVVQNYRNAHTIAVRTIEGRTSTEDLRQAVISCRALFEEMLLDDVEPPSSDTAASAAAASRPAERPRVDELH
jgi:hypothetical protein